MTIRRPVSNVAFFLGLLLLAGATAMFITARYAPAEGFADLARVVGAMMLAGLSAPPFAVSVWFATTRSRLVLSAIGCLFALGPAIVFVTVGSTGGLLLGLLFFASAAAGLVGAAIRWRVPAQGANV